MRVKWGQEYPVRPRSSLISLAAAAAVINGCSARDPVNKTPVYHVGTPTNRSTTYSWVPHNEPFYVQPGLNGGNPKQAVQPVTSQPRFEPYSPLATTVYDAVKGAGVDTTYLTASAKGDAVVLDGRLPTSGDHDKALAAARSVPGVKTVIDHMKVE